MKKKIIIILYIFTIILTGCSKKNDYEKTLDLLSKKTLKYKKDNKLNITNDIYINFNLLNVSIPQDCNNLSGVILSKENTLPILMCDSYKTKLNENEYKYIKLIGNEIEFIGEKEEYIELGYESIYDVTITGNVLDSKGVYTITYTVNKNKEILEVVKRTVIRTEDRVKEDIYPKLELMNDELLYLNNESEINFEEINAYDKLDGDIKDKIKLKNDIIFDKDGENELIFYVTNSKGYTTGIKRKVFIIGNEDQSKITVTKKIIPEYPTNDKKTIALIINGQYFKEVILPNGEKLDTPDILFDVTDNGIYEFIIKDKSNLEYKEIVEITDIDKQKPTLACNAIVLDQKVFVTSTANDDSGINNYIYKVNGEEEKNNSATYNFSRDVLDKMPEINVTVFDKAGNETTSTCELTDKTTKSVCELNYIYHGKKYSLTNAQIDRIACVVQSEYGGNDYVGLKAVASHMGNLYEYKRWQGDPRANKSFFNYIENPVRKGYDMGWYEGAKRYCSSVKQMAKKAVIDCIVNGNRTLPPWVQDYYNYPAPFANWGDEKKYIPFKSHFKDPYSGGGSGTVYCITAAKDRSDGNIFYYNEGYKKHCDKTYTYDIEIYHE